MKTNIATALAALALGLTIAPSSLAQDPTINQHLANINRELSPRNKTGPNGQKIQAAALALTKRTPAGLRRPATPTTDDGAELDSAAVEPQAPLPITEQHRIKLLDIYQQLALALSRAARTSPDAVRAAYRPIDNFVDGIQDLGQLTPRSPDFVQKLNQLLNTPLPR